MFCLIDRGGMRCEVSEVFQADCCLGTWGWAVYKTQSLPILSLSIATCSLVDVWMIIAMIARPDNPCCYCCLLGIDEDQVWIDAKEKRDGRRKDREGDRLVSRVLAAFLLLERT